MELPQKPPNHSGEHQGLVVLRTQVNNLVDAYLSQDPRPSLSDFAEVFGAQEYIETNKRKKAVIVRVAEFKESIVQRIWRNKKNKEDTGEGSLPQGLHMLDMTILPPDQQEIRVGNGNGLEEREYIPRTEYLRELLEEFGESYEIIGGKNTENMMRTRTYFIFFLERSKLAVFVNNEEGNATFVFHDVVTLENALYLAQLTKQELKEGEVHEFPMHQINWNGNKEAWQEEVLEGMTMTKERKEERKREPVQTGETNEEKIKKAEEGWMPISAIAKLLEKNYTWVEKRIAKIIEEKPEWDGKEMQSPYGHTSKHYPPEVISLLQKEAENLPERASRDWCTMSKLRATTKKDRGWIEKEIAKIIKEKPELQAVDKLTPDKQMVPHYPSQLLEELQKKINNLPKVAPSDWITKSKISKKTGKTERWVTKKIAEIVSKYQNLHGKPFLDKSNQECIFYPPELFEMINSEVTNAPEQAPQSWLTMGAMRKEIKNNPVWIKKTIAEEIRKNPQLDGKEKLDIQKKKAFHYPPELVEILKQKARE